MEEIEFEELKNQLDLGRAHDVTTVIAREREVAVVRKHAYPPSGYRTPSGGVHPEESFIDGAVREASVRSVAAAKPEPESEERRRT